MRAEINLVLTKRLSQKTQLINGTHHVMYSFACSTNVADKKKSVIIHDGIRRQMSSLPMFVY
jgi:hypothetical protein